MNPLLDKDFLNQLDRTLLKETYARIIALNQDEEMLETIEGNISQGNINIDGTSAVRRTCSLTIVANELNIHEYYWGLHTKFKLYLGIKNGINKDYEDIIWFPQGTYVISSFTTSQTISSYTISVQGKDKMTLLNGDLGGTITALTHNFGEYDYTNENGYTTTQQNLIKNIIIDSVHEFAKEPIHNIIVNDLDDMGVELMEYRGKDPLYVVIDEQTQEPSNMTLNGEQQYYDKNGQQIMIKDIEIYNPLFDLEQQNVVVRPTVVRNAQGREFTIAKIEYGMTAGYRTTGLVYAGDLILNVGETITSMLNKIVDMLGEFEYFYDLDGRFIFQRRKTYIQVPFNNWYRTFDEEYVDSTAYTSSISYSFEDGILVSSYSNNPNFAELKNDFSIWGTKKSVTGDALPVHMRFAIDDKPVYYKTYDGVNTYITSDTRNETGKVVDWRELIYQMAIDFRRYNRQDDFYITIAKNNKDYYPSGITGYEHYYTDMEGFWRQLYNPEYEGSYNANFMTKNEYEANPSNYYYKAPKYYQCQNDEQYHSNIVYYSYQSDERLGTDILKPITITRNEYDDNRTKYYYIKEEDSYEIKSCIITEAWRSNDPVYYLDNKGNGKRTVNKETYEANPSRYYFVDTSSYSPCFKIEEHNKYYTYYSDDDGKIVNNLSKEDYLTEPHKYYRIENKYRQCQSTDTFGLEHIYYIKETQAITGLVIYTRVYAIDEDKFQSDKSKYYLLEESDVRIECCVPIGVYNFSNEYVNKEQEQVLITSQSQYDLRASVADLYVKENAYTCCVHPIGYSSLIEFMSKTENEYRDDNWAEEVYTAPERLNFWIDFLDEDSELQKYSCHNIGNRPKATNDSNIKSIYYRETPTVIFTYEGEDVDWVKLGYTYIQLPAHMENLFSVSAQGKSAKNVLDDYLYKYACCTETISLSTIPIYHLEPNTRIFVRDDNSGINGEYIVTRYSLPIGHNGSMSITATKAVDRLY